MLLHEDRAIDTLLDKLPLSPDVNLVPIAVPEVEALASAADIALIMLLHEFVTVADVLANVVPTILIAVTRAIICVPALPMPTEAADIAPIPVATAAKLAPISNKFKPVII